MRVDGVFAEHRSLKQEELANALGVSEDTVRNWEKGRTVPLGEYLRRIGENFGKGWL